jgi:monoamine oxidase
VITRRAALSGGLAAGALGPVHAEDGAPSGADVAIVGAGAAGIAASRTLRALGVGHVVLEASDRIGGRARTVATPAGPFDVGAQWLHSFDRNPLARAGEAIGARFIRDRARDDRLLIGARRARDEEEAAFDRALARLEAGDPSGRDLAAAAILTPRTPPERLAAATFADLEHGVAPQDLSLADAATQIATGDERFVAGGLGAMVARLGAGAPVRLNVAVRRVDHGGARVRLDTDRGTLEAKAVIVTVSTGVLASGALRFSPALPSALEQAIHDLPMGLLNKAFFALRPGAAPAGVHVTRIDAAGRVGSLVTGAGVAVTFVGGPVARALEAQGRGAAAAFHRALVVVALGASALARPEAVAITTWGRDPWTLGAYSAARPGRAAARRALVTELSGRVDFAGEAWEPVWATQAAGAWRSGERAARRVAERLARG